MNPGPRPKKTGANLGHQLGLTTRTYHVGSAVLLILAEGFGGDGCRNCSDYPVGGLPPPWTVARRSGLLRPCFSSRSRLISFTRSMSFWGSCSTAAWAHNSLHRSSLFTMTSRL